MQTGAGGAAAPEGAAAGFDGELRRKTRRSVGWTIARAVSDQFFSFVVFVLLAQLLSPADIGIFAMAYVFAEVGRIVATSVTVPSTDGGVGFGGGDGSSGDGSGHAPTGPVTR